MNRTGICCFVLNDDLSRLANSNFRSTTQAAMGRRTLAVQYETINTIVKHNMRSVITLMRYMSTLPYERRMFRIGSDMLPMYEHPIYKELYDSDMMNTVRYSLAIAGRIARDNNIRLSMHPDQYCVLNSATDDVVDRAISVMEYHGDIAAMMGYGLVKQDFKINVHLNGRADVIPYERLSDTVRNCMTFENDEKTGNIDRVLSICEKWDVPCVFDIHHHWCNSGEYMDVSSDTIKRVYATWEDTNFRPVMHVSQPHETIWTDNSTLPCMDTILQSKNRKDTYKHSDMISNQALIEHLSNGFRDIFDFQIEAKNKNIASAQLHHALLNLQCA